MVVSIPYMKHQTMITLALFLLLLPNLLHVCADIHGGSPIEDEIETQIDPRSPHHFKTFETLNVRQVGFGIVSVFDKAKNELIPVNIGNWEKWAAA
jgi:hypothetical protein